MRIYLIIFKLYLLTDVVLYRLSSKNVIVHLFGARLNSSCFIANNRLNGATCDGFPGFRLLAKPIIRLQVAPRRSILDRLGLDYENLLRNHDPGVINYNTRLTDFGGVDITNMDDIYGKIYDRRVLIKQLRYFLECDDFHSLPRLLRDNKGLLNKEDCYAFIKDFDHLIHVRLKYQYPQMENLEDSVKFLVARYILQHVTQQDLESRSYYVWLKPGEMPPDVPDYTDDYIEPKATIEKPIHVHDMATYRKLITHFKHLDKDTRLKHIRELYHRIVKSKHNKLYDCLWKYQRLKPFDKLTYRRKVRTKIEIDRVCPFLSRPRRCTEAHVKEATQNFKDAIDKEDLATACRLFKRYTRRIDLKNNIDLLRRFMDLMGNMHKSRKYHIDSMRLLRLLYWSTMKRHKILIKYNEPFIVRDSGKTMKDMYEEQMARHRKHRDERNREFMRQRGIDVDRMEDFSNAYGEDWIPILYPDEYEAALKKHEERMIKLRKKLQKVQMQNQMKNDSDNDPFG